jgi:hypothetical protein
LPHHLFVSRAGRMYCCCRFVAGDAGRRWALAQGLPAAPISEQAPQVRAGSDWWNDDTQPVPTQDCRLPAVGLQSHKHQWHWISQGKGYLHATYPAVVSELQMSVPVLHATACGHPMYALHTQRQWHTMFERIPLLCVRLTNAVACDASSQVCLAAVPQHPSTSTGSSRPGCTATATACCHTPKGSSCRGHSQQTAAAARQ